MPALEGSIESDGISVPLFSKSTDENCNEEVGIEALLIADSIIELSTWDDGWDVITAEIAAELAPMLSDGNAEIFHKNLADDFDTLEISTFRAVLKMGACLFCDHDSFLTFVINLMFDSLSCF